jgi:hypothetical protein
VSAARGRGPEVGCFVWEAREPLHHARFPAFRRSAQDPLACREPEKPCPPSGHSRTAGQQLRANALSELSAHKGVGRLSWHEMPHDFCTLFDRNYLARGLVLYRSLVAAGDPFTLRVFCMDEETAEVLRVLALPSLEVVSLQELEREDAELAGVRSTRSHIELMWTATPAVCLATLKREPQVDAVTYLDADLMFFSSPQPIFDEMSDRSIAITPHRYAPRWQHYEATSGIYNVGWLTFRRDDAGLQALHWWRDRCLEWCKAVAEDGKFGDQAYLDDWPERFDHVHVVQHPGAGLAPWNAEAFAVEKKEEGLTVDDRPLVFFHFHGLRLIRGGPVAEVGSLLGVYQRTGGLRWRSGYPVSSRDRALLWQPYLGALEQAFNDIRGADPGFNAGVIPADAREVLWVTRDRVLGQTT